MYEKSKNNPWQWGFVAAVWIVLGVIAVWSCIPILAQGQAPIIMTVTLNLKKSADGALLYSAEKNIGSILHDNLFIIDGVDYTLEEIRVTKDSFSLQIQDDTNEVDEVAVLAGQYLVFKRGLSPIGYSNATALIPSAGDTSSSTALLKNMHGLQQDDFLSYIRFEITETKPIVNRYPEQIQPLPDKKHALAAGPITIPLTEHFRDPEGYPLFFDVLVDGKCCIATVSVVREVLTITPIGDGTVTIEIDIYDRAGNVETDSFKMTIVAEEREQKKSTDTVTPSIITTSLEVPSAEHPEITITVDHKQQAREDLEIIFGGDTTCTALSSDTIRGTSAGMVTAKPIYTGILTGSTFSGRYGYNRDEYKSEHLTPAIIETGGAVYTIDELTYTPADTSYLSVQIKKEQDVALPTMPETIANTYDTIGVSSDVVWSAQMLLNQTKCPVATEGVGSQGEETRYFGGLTQAAIKCYQQSQNTTIDGTLTPTLYKALFNAYQEKKKASEQKQTSQYSDFSDYYLTFKRESGSVIHSIAMKDADVKDGVAHFVLGADVPLHNKALFDGSTSTIVEMARLRPGDAPYIPPQEYAVQITGPSDIYNDCTLTVEDVAGHRATESATLSIFTIFPSEKEKDADDSTYRGPELPEEGDTPKKPYSIIGEAKEKESLEETLYVAKLAVYLANPNLSVSSVQMVPIGRRADIPEVLELQRFLNRVGYTVAKTGWGSQGKETKYFGPATQRALEAFQEGMDIPVTGEMDQETRKAIIRAAVTHLKGALAYPPNTPPTPLL